VHERATTVHAPLKRGGRHRLGSEAVLFGKAFGKVAYRSADNPKRSYKYVVGILQTEAEQ